MRNSRSVIRRLKIFFKTSYGLLLSLAVTIALFYSYDRNVIIDQNDSVLCGSNDDSYISRAAIIGNPDPECAESARTLDCFFKNGDATEKEYFEINQSNCRRAVSFPHEVVKVMNLFPNSETLLDIGANVGHVTLPVLNLKNNHRVISFEPVKDNVDQIKKKLCQCKDKGLENRVQLYQSALSEDTGDVTIHVPMRRKDNAALSSEAATANILRKSRPQTTIKLKGDDVLKSINASPRVIKIDVQGHELFVLKGLYDYLSHADNVLVIAEFDRRLTEKSNVNPMDIWKLMAEDLQYQVFSNQAVVSVNNNVIEVEGTPFTSSSFPPGGTMDLMFLRPQM